MSGAVQEISVSALDILRHTLGYNYSPRRDRNFYCAGLIDHQPSDVIRELVEAGLMLPQKTINGGNDQYFQASAAGLAYVLDRQLSQQKLTRSQRRYQQYLRVADVMSFRDWLETEKRSSEL